MGEVYTRGLPYDSQFVAPMAEDVPNPPKPMRPMPAMNGMRV